jgi:hypothetical protein
MRDHYIAVLSPEGVTVVRRKARGGLDLKVDEPVTTQAAQGGASPEDLALAAVEALGRTLARPEIGDGRLSVLLSSHFVRFQLLPWRDEIGSVAELQVYAQISFEQVYGTVAASWTPMVAPDREGRPRLAAAVPTATLRQLEAQVAAGPNRLSLDSVQPYLTAAFNRLCQPECGDDFLFVLAEPARTCLLSAAAGYWQSVRVSAGDDEVSALSALIEREMHLSAPNTAGHKKILVHSPRRSRLDFPESSWGPAQVLAVEIPDELSSVADARLGMAMTLV